MNKPSSVARAGRIAAFLTTLAKHPKACAKATLSALRRLYRDDLSVFALESRTDKGPNGHGYSAVYSDYFSQRRSEPLVLVEIGLLMHKIQWKIGGNSFNDAPSLRMWKRYFPNSKIIGFDIADFSSVKLPGCTIVRGDQSDRLDLNKIGSHCPDGVDIIIDDGLHASLHQQVTLAALFPMMKRGGLYFIEDLNYQPQGTEVEGVPLTRDLLRMFSSGEYESCSPSIAITNEEWIRLRKEVKSIRWYDSLKGSRRRLTDSMAVLERC